tara:strand:- start:644 stop:1351 length:708 start_codon:yes stop_codon:yes gene_type:complete
MSNIRIFYQENLSNNLTGKLEKKQSHYIAKVMRVKETEKFNVFNSSGEWVAKIIKIINGIVEFKIIKQLRSVEGSNEIWLAFSPIKSNYFNFMIQKATELGVTKFLPIIFDRTIVRKVNIERLKKIIIEASEQSNRLVVPKIEKVLTLESFIKSNKKLNIIFGDINSKNNKINVKKIKNNPICIIIGPEGDFTEHERQKILKIENIQSLKLHNNILRSETAAISAISIINYFSNL